MMKTCKKICHKLKLWNVYLDIFREVEILMKIETRCRKYFILYFHRKIYSIWNDKKPPLGMCCAGWKIYWSLCEIANFTSFSRGFVPPKYYYRKVITLPFFHSFPSMLLLLINNKWRRRRAWTHKRTKAHKIFERVQEKGKGCFKIDDSKILSRRFFGNVLNEFFC